MGVANRLVLALAAFYFALVPSNSQVINQSRHQPAPAFEINQIPSNWIKNHQLFEEWVSTLNADYIHIETPLVVANYYPGIEERIIDLVSITVPQVIFFGETHSNIQYGVVFEQDNRSITSMLGDLYDLGYRKIAFEIDMEDQNHVDDFLMNRISGTELENRILYLRNMCTGQMLEEARMLGMDIIIYDSRSYGSNGPAPGTERDYIQYLNIMDQTNNTNGTLNEGLIICGGKDHDKRKPGRYYFPDRTYLEDQILLAQNLSEQNTVLSVNYAPISNNFNQQIEDHISADILFFIRS